MIDLSYKNPNKKEKETEIPLIFKFWILVIFAAFFAYVMLSGIVGELNIF